MSDEVKGVKKSWINRHPALTGFGVFIILIILIGSGGKSKQANTNNSTRQNQEPVVEAIVVSSEALRKAYKANEVSGDNQYKGKLVEISGTVNTIGKDVLDEAYVTFETSEQYAFDKVQCMFKEDQQSLLADLKKGQSIKVQGTVSGVSIGSVIVRNCKITVK